MHKTFAKEILKEYELLRAKAEQAALNFKESMYVKAPLLKETDINLKKLGLRLARYAANGDTEQIKTCEEEIAELRSIRKSILKELKIGESKFLPKYSCNNCKDTGYVTKNLTSIPIMCRCFKQKLINAHYSLSNLDQVLSEENFDNFDIRLFSDIVDEKEGLSARKNMENVFRIATNFTKGFGSEFANLLLYGETGLGKTFVCHSIAKELLDRGFTVLYLTSPRLIRIIEKSRNFYEDQAETNEILKTIDDVDLLILDDLGSEVMTVVTIASLFDIINHRLITKKPMVISTNLDQNSLMEHYSERIVSRFIASYQIVKFFGRNIRISKKLGQA